MKRTRSDHAALNADDLTTKRIVRRKVTSRDNRHSLSPVDDLETQHQQQQQRREVRTTSSVLKYVKYSSGGSSGGGGSTGEKYTSSKYSKYGDSDYSENKFDRYEQRHSGGGGGKGREMDESIERGSIPRRVSAREHTNHHDGSNNMRFATYNERFDFSLRIGSLDLEMHDGELKTCLFNLFKHYGYVHIKVLGRGIERHAFINFMKKEDAQRAVSEMSEFVLEDVSLKTEWSKSTLHRYPEVVNNPYLVRSRRAGLSTRHSTSANRTRHHDDHYDSYVDSGSGRDSIPPPTATRSREKAYTTREVSTSRRSREVARDIHHHHGHTRELSPVPRELGPRRVSRELSSRSVAREHDIDERDSRDISYKLSSSVSSPLPHSHDHHSSTSGSGGGQSSSRHEPRTVVPITDPTATRTLFVGNLEPDITERELRDLFGPYGRIESVDIKTQRVSGSTYSFVKFMTINDAINAKNDMHGRKYGEYRLKIGFGRGAPSGKVWVGNLTCMTDFKEVQQELDRFGLIRKTDYQDGDNHAYVQLDSLDAAQAAIASLTGYRIRNSGRILKIDLCKPMHLREDADFHLRHMSTDIEESYPTSPVFKRKVRDQDYHHHHHHHHENDVSVRRVKSDVDNASSSVKGERVFSSSSKGRSSREENRRDYRKRAHSPQPGKDGYHGNAGRMHSDDLNGVTDSEYHSNKRPRMNESGPSRRAGGGDRDRDRDRERNRSNRESERDTKRSMSSEKDKRDHSGRKRDGENPEENSESKQSKLSDEKTEKEEPPKPVLEPSLSDLVTAKDTALKLDSAPDQLAMDTGAGGSGTLQPTVPETLNDLAILYPVAWKGNMVLKNTGFPTRMHLVGGDPAVAEMLLRTREGKDDLPLLRITQRLRLEQPRLEEVNKRMLSAGPSGYCILLALSGPIPSAPLSPETETTMQLRPLKSLVSYLKQKEAAGIVALSGPEGSDTASASVDKDAIGVLHAFPPCEFSQSQLVKIAPRLGEEPAKEDHIVVLLVKGNV